LIAISREDELKQARLVSATENWQGTGKV